MNAQVKLIRSFVEAWDDNRLYDLQMMLMDGATLSHPHMNDSKPITSERMAALRHAYNGHYMVRDIEFLRQFDDGKTKEYRIRLLETKDITAEVLWFILVIDLTIAEDDGGSRLAEERNYKIRCINFVGSEIEKNLNIKLVPMEKRNIDLVSVEQGIELLVDFLERNDKKGLCSLFSNNAEIYHFLYINPMSPEIFAEIMIPKIPITIKIIKIIPNNDGKAIVYLEEKSVHKQEYRKQILMTIYIHKNAIQELCVLSMKDALEGECKSTI